MASCQERIEELARTYTAKEKEYETVVKVCCGTGCITSGALKVYERLSQAFEKIPSVRVKKTGCHGLCEKGPIVVCGDDEILYQSVGKRDIDEDVSLLLATVTEKRVADKLLFRGRDKEKYVSPHDIPFYKGQKRIVLALNGSIDPESLEEYCARGGYRAPFKAFAMDPDEIINGVTKAGLRGRGGGGFLTGRKWSTVRKASSSPKYILANGDEGDPGAFMDRSLMEGTPHSILAGMIIGAYALGAHQGFIYVRDEYPLAVHRLTLAIESARSLGLLGKKIFDTDFDFDVAVYRGGGAFVCGESTALMASIEGRAGEPRAKYVHTAEVGLWDKPTCLNNVETWANVPYIINKGPDHYASIGTTGSKGTKIFSLVGKVTNTGLIEVPMGMSLRQIIFDLGGGLKGKRAFKAVQTGGPSGGCIPEKFLDMPVDFDSLYEVGSMMGSGGMIVMDERDCMVDVARYFLRFLTEESCGKCVPCREGVRRMYEIVDRITKGTGTLKDLDHLEELGRAVQIGSLCGLGQSAPNPVLSTIRYFMDEYKAHILERRCPAGVCKELTRFVIDPDLCTGCMRCAKECPTAAITGERKKPHTIDTTTCVTCGICHDVCPVEAVKIS